MGSALWRFEMSVLVLVSVVVFLVLLQGFLLQTACAVAGERPPEYGEALMTAIIAGLFSVVASTAFGCTFGVFIGLFSKYLAWFGSLAVGTAVTASVYRSRLFLSSGQSVVVAVIHHVLGYLVSGLVWALWSYWP
jgi:hypothetical protein